MIGVILVFSILNLLVLVIIRELFWLFLIKFYIDIFKKLKISNSDCVCPVNNVFHYTLNCKQSNLKSDIPVQCKRIHWHFESLCCRQGTGGFNITWNLKGLKKNPGFLKKTSPQWCVFFQELIYLGSMIRSAYSPPLLQTSALQV